MSEHTQPDPLELRKKLRKQISKNIQNNLQRQKDCTSRENTIFARLNGFSPTYSGWTDFIIDDVTDLVVASVSPLENTEVELGATND